jgi:hypothetical protein
MGRLDEAGRVLDRVVALRERTGRLDGPGELDLGLGELFLARHAPDKALPLLERSLVLHQAAPDGAVELTLAEALWQVGTDRARARTLVGQARARYEKLGHGPGMERATRWLDDHPVLATAHRP